MLENHLKLEQNSREANVSLGMKHGSSSKLIPWFWAIFADFQNQVLFQTMSAKYEPS